MIAISVNFKTGESYETELSSLNFGIVTDDQNSTRRL
jgi:hypothetical protein